nr:hypothetical protein CFP56_64536 [Quercus suber]
MSLSPRIKKPDKSPLICKNKNRQGRSSSSSMASITTMMMTTIPSEFQQQPRTSTQSCHVTIGCSHLLTCPKSTCTNFCDMQHYLCRSLLFPSSPQRRGLTRLTKPISASSSGLEASITDQKGKTIKLKSAKIVIESQDENKMQIQVDLTGDETEKVFDQVLTNLARTAPPVPGFRRQKGGPKKLSLANAW